LAFLLRSSLSSLEIKVCGSLRWVGIRSASVSLVSASVPTFCSTCRLLALVVLAGWAAAAQPPRAGEPDPSLLLESESPAWDGCLAVAAVFYCTKNALLLNF